MKGHLQKIAILCLCAMLIGIFTSSCQQATPTGTNAATTGSTTAKPAVTTPAATTSKSITLVDKLTELHVMREENASQVLRNDSTVNKYIEKTLNVKIIIEAVPAASYVDKTKVLIGTNNMPDIMKVTLSDVRQYSRDKMFVNLTDNTAKLPNFFKVFNSQPTLSKLNVDGKTYSFPIIRRASAYDDPSGQQPVIRTDLLTKYNLAIPKTFDELANVLKVFKDNNPDKIPLTNRKGGSTSATQKVLDTMAYPLGSGSTMYYDQDISGGKYVYGPADSHFKEVLTYLNKLYKAGLLDKDYATNTVDLWKEKMSSGKALMYFDNTGFRIDYEIALKKIEPAATLDVIPTLTNSLGQTRNFIYDMNWPDQHYVIADSSKNKDVALAFFNWAFSEDGCNTKSYGILGETYDMVSGAPMLKTSLIDQIIALKTTAPSYELQSQVGIGLLDFTPYIDIGAGEIVKRATQSPADLKRLDATRVMNQNDKGLRVPIYDPPLNAADTERYKQLKSAVDNILIPEYDKYIMGLASIDKYDEVIAKARAAGAQEMEDIYNKANAAYK